MIAILREADQIPVAEVARLHKVSEQAIYAWRRCGANRESSPTTNASPA